MTIDKDRVLIFDTTLRDGEQSPGATMSHDEKLEIAALLDEMGVDIIEAGFPIASEGDFAAVSEIAHSVDAKVIVDNVFATPIYSKAIQQGADVVVYSSAINRKNPEIRDIYSLSLSSR